MLSEVINEQVHGLLDLLNSDAQPGFVDGTDANRRPRDNRLTRRSFYAPSGTSPGRSGPSGAVRLT
jgi:hypothetical protein